MGKPKKLRSSIKAFQEAIIGINQVIPICSHPSRTESFREIFNSLDSIFNTPSSSASSSFDLCNNTTHESKTHKQNHQKNKHQKPLEEESISSTLSTSSNLSSSSSSSSIPVMDLNEQESIPTGLISSTRFFFSPCTTKSIMKDPKIEMGLGEIDPGLEETGDVIVIEAGFCKQSIPTAMASDDPFKDFRVSMEEMVEAYGLREWEGLQDLLHWYLRLNEKKTHKIIVLAFVDLLMDLISQGNNLSFSSSQPHPSPHLHHCSFD